MQISDLKKCLVGGYQKESVYQYIAALNEEFSGKLMEKDEKLEEALLELKEKNKALEAELSAAKEENAAFQKLHFAVSDSIIGAQSYAEQLKEETAQKELALRQQLEREASKCQGRVEHYKSEIENFRSHLKTLLEDMDRTLQAALNSAEELYEVDPVSTSPDWKTGEDSAKTVAGNNMSMFQKKREK